MSGGHFDYKQYVISEIADEVENVILKNRKPIPYDCLDRWEQERYGFSKEAYDKADDKPMYNDYPQEVIGRLREGVRVLRQAAVYAQRADYLLSGDDGGESFAERLNEELAALERKEAEK